MTELETPVRELRDICRQIAPDLRARALAVDADPADMAPHLDSPTLVLLRTASTPKRFREEDVPLHAAEYVDSCLARAVANVELSRYGDAGMLAANTGPSLAGLAVDALGDEAQRERFYRGLADGRTWSFFAMTEPAVGSDASAMTTRLDTGPDGLTLHGGKKYVANAGRGTLGVVFARTGPGPLSIRAVLVSAPAPGWTGGSLETIGLRGARIGELSFAGVPVTPDAVLGAHLPPSRRGLWGAGRAFNVMRVQLSAQAVGMALAAYDLVAAERPGWAGLEPTRSRLRAAEQLVHDVAAGVDASPDDRAHPSMAKLHATGLAVRVTRWAERSLGAGSLAAYPLLEKWCRDVGAFEFMDGTSNILRLTIAPTSAPRRKGTP